jgi:hypothetical protein
VSSSHCVSCIEKPLVVFHVIIFCYGRYLQLQNVYNIGHFKSRTTLSNVINLFLLQNSCFLAEIS